MRKNAINIDDLDSHPAFLRLVDFIERLALEKELNELQGDNFDANDDYGRGYLPAFLDADPLDELPW